MGMTMGMRWLAGQLASNSRNSLSANTWKQYERAWLKFVAFCAQHEMDPHRCNSAFVSLYFTQLNNEGEQRAVGHQLIDQASAAISASYRIAGLASPCDGPLCTVAHEAARCTLITQKRPRAEVAFEDLQQLLNHHLPPNGPEPTLEVRMLVTGVLLCYTGLLRFDDLSRVLVHEDLLRIYPGEHLELFLWKSKTDQCAEGAWVTIGATEGPHCVVGLVEKLLARGAYDRSPPPGRDGGPLIRAVVTDAGGEQRLEHRSTQLPEITPALQYKVVLKRVNELFGEAGVTKKIGMHAFRVAGATEAVNAGTDRVMVQKLGRWATAETFEKVYVKDTVPKRDHRAYN
ncbi:hypothetical protein TSOC_010494 [Tetrabaena socialis]|uniref:Core-binding (CB) domain-containing protein n=1 Tax=Tetrabaena socialis TaxID=47790 RepID=A0A2J7ZT65_9CHLO|nr:hypothetical protein TSOC_010494 [Tetrabaena socialis]|eukprot:PNH03452.1 hypothetical protein TSOC_010494 [Tetrabaena socialis]